MNKAIVEKTIEEMEKELTNEMNLHDWYYLYSDDINVYRLGRDHNHLVDTLFKNFKLKVGDEKAKEIWNANCNKDFKII